MQSRTSRLYFLVAALVALVTTALTMNRPSFASSTVAMATVSTADASSVSITVECGQQNRVDTRWDMTATVKRADGTECTVYVDIPRDSTATAIAGLLKSAIEAVCEVTVNVTSPVGGTGTLGGGNVKTVTITGGSFGNIETRKYKSKKIACHNCGQYRVYYAPKPKADHLKVAKVVNKQSSGLLAPAPLPLLDVTIELTSVTAEPFVEFNLFGVRGSAEFEMTYEGKFSPGATPDEVLKNVARWLLARGFTVTRPSQTILTVTPPTSVTLHLASFGVWCSYDIPPEADHDPAPHTYSCYDVDEGIVLSDPDFTITATY